MRAHGIDISKYQGSYTPAPIPPRPVDFVIQRLSYGMMRDERIAQLTPPVMTMPLRGAYHYYSSAAPWKDQANHFIDLMGGKYDFWAWDVEKSYNNNSTRFVYGVGAAMEYIGEQTGLPGLLYLNIDVWNTWMYPVWADLRKFDLWIARYFFSRNPEGNPKPPANMRQDWRIWQYDDKGGGNRGKEYGAGSFGLDLNVYNGDSIDLMLWAGKTVAPTYQICPLDGTRCTGKETA